MTVCASAAYSHWLAERTILAEPMKAGMRQLRYDVRQMEKHGGA